MGMQDYFSCLCKCLRLSAKPSIQLVLLMIFFLYFGLPSVQRFQAREVMVVTSKRATGGIPAPAITVMPRNPQTNLGWKSSSLNFTYPNLLQAFCGDTTSWNTGIDDCIKENTYNRTDAFKDVLLGLATRKSLLKDDDLWTEDVTSTWYGKTYTLNIEKNIGVDDATSQLFLAVGYDLNYIMILHDPFYFAVNSNPTVFPGTWLTIHPNETESYYNGLTLNDVEELDLPEDPCNPDRDYNFQACIKESLSRQVGCRTRWDRWSQPDRPLCTQMAQYR
jgi:hypothetical protein